MHLKMDGSAGQVCIVVESEDMISLIARTGDDRVSVLMNEEIAERICTALGQLLTDRAMRRDPELERRAMALADQVETAEHLADAQPPSAADMTEGELILGRRVPPK